MVCSLEYWGSPPRVRGKVQPERDVQDAARITPAYAGKRMLLGKHDRLCGDHPRVCGEKKPGPRFSGPRTGSPPRMRGKAFFEAMLNLNQGITPAYAGKRKQQAEFNGLSEDHPRVCGEKGFTSATQTSSGGSPPRMRGKAVQVPGAAAPTGITPAYAGKRPLASLTTSTARDHPRVCGEKNNLRQAFSIQQGSPPRMRGKEIEANRDAIAHRITPACAGKSQKRYGD